MKIDLVFWRRWFCLLFIASTLGIMIVFVSCATPVTTPTPTPAAKQSPAAIATPTSAPVPTATKGPVTGGNLRLGVLGEAMTLDPHAPRTARQIWLFSNLYETLIDLSPTLELVPGLAESWEVSPDGMAMTFKLRKGVKFHDGTDFNAAAVKFNFDRLQDPEQKALNSVNIQDVRSTDVVDDYTVRLSMKRPSAPTLAGLTEEGTNIVSPDAVKRWGKDEYGRHGVGTGPFELVEWVRDDHLTMKRFDGYWKKDKAGNKLPYLDGLTWKPIVEETVRLTNLRVGALEWIHYPPAKDVATIKASPDFKYDASAPLGSYNIRFSSERPPFNNKSLRQAINWAIDREAIVKGVLFGAAVAQGTLSNPDVWPYDPNFRGYSYDPAKAKAKMAEGGQPNGFSFTLLVATTSMETSVGEALQSQFAKLGINIQLQKVDSTTLFSILADRKFEAGFAQRRAATDQYAIYTDTVTGSPRNSWGYSNRKYDELVAKAAKTFAKEEKTTLYREIEKELVDDPPYGYAFFTPNDVAMGRKVQGYVSLPVLWAKFGSVWLEK